MKYYNYIWKTSERDNPNIEKIINFDNFQNNIQKEEIIICLFYELENKELFFEKDLNFVFTFDNNKVNNLSNQDNLELKRSYSSQILPKNNYPQYNNCNNNFHS